MLTLYGAKGSGAAAIEAALQIAALPFGWVEAATWQPGAGRRAQMIRGLVFAAANRALPPSA